VEEAEKKLEQKYRNSHKNPVLDLRIMTESFKSYFNSKTNKKPK
jgi:hypothetical protein